VEAMVRMPKQPNGTPGKKPPAPSVKVRMAGRLWSNDQAESRLSHRRSAVDCAEETDEAETGRAPQAGSNTARSGSMSRLRPPMRIRCHPTSSTACGQTSISQTVCRIQQLN